MARRIPPPSDDSEALLTFSFAAFVGSALLVRRIGQARETFPACNASSDVVFIFLLGSIILAGRWPTLLAPELNVDESYFLAGVQKLQQDPV